MSDRLTTLIDQSGPLTAVECGEFDKLLAVEARKPNPRYRSRDGGRTIDVLVPPATATATAARAAAPTDPFSIPFEQAKSRCNQLAARRSLSEAESGEFLRLCERAKRGY